MSHNSPRDPGRRTRAAGFPFEAPRSALRRAWRLLAADWTRLEVAALVLLLACAGAAWAFVELADEMLEGDTDTWDRKILLAMRAAEDADDPIGPVWFEEMVRDVTAFGGYAAMLGLTALVAGFLWLDGRRSMALLIALAVASGVGLSTLLKHGFERPRPDLVPHMMPVSTPSFPSGHSMVSAVAYLTLGAMLARTQARKRLKVYVLASAFLLTAAIGTSRVYLGVHWPSDVLAGWAAGACWALACWLAAWRLQVISAAEPES
jgi:undecaprenyl-diphosphatase